MTAIRHLMTILLMFCFSLTANAAPPSKTVAVVNGSPLFESELNQEINVIMPMNQSFHGKLSDEKMRKIRSDALKNLVDLELKAQDARASGIKITQSRLDEEMSKTEKKFNSKDAFLAALKSADFTSESFMLMLNRKLLADKVRLQKVDEKISVTPLTVKAFYDNNVTKYSKPDEFRASVILLRVDPSSTKEERLVVIDRAEKLHKRISTGTPFDDLAANESDDPSRIKGGDIGFFHAGRMEEEFEKAVAKLKVGEVSPIIETLRGYVIIKLTDKRSARQIPFVEIQDKISKDLIDSEKKNLSEVWMGSLYKKAVITYPGDK